MLDADVATRCDLVERFGHSGYAQVFNTCQNALGVTSGDIWTIYHATHLNKGRKMAFACGSIHKRV